jgi:hypothetical protein
MMKQQQRMAAKTTSAKDQRKISGKSDALDVKWLCGEKRRAKKRRA